MPSLPPVATSLRPPESNSATVVLSQSWSSFGRSWYHHLSLPVRASIATVEIVNRFAPLRMPFW